MLAKPKNKNLYSVYLTILLVINIYLHVYIRFKLFVHDSHSAPTWNAITPLSNVVIFVGFAAFDESMIFWLRIPFEFGRWRSTWAWKMISQILFKIAKMSNFKQNYFRKPTIYFMLKSTVNRTSGQCLVPNEYCVNEKTSGQNTQNC